MNNKNKRLFFAFETHSPWENKLPEGRILQKKDRHLTIAFLGNVNWPSLQAILGEFPLPPMRVGLTGTFDRLLILPPKRPNVAAYHAEWTYAVFDFDQYQATIALWLEKKGFPIRLHRTGFLPHVTICRRPFNQTEWKEHFTPLPFYISNFHLYESHPGLNYRPIWTHPILPPFDSKFAYGENEKQLSIHKTFAEEHGRRFPVQANHHLPMPKDILRIALDR